MFLLSRELQSVTQEADLLTYTKQQGQALQALPFTEAELVITLGQILQQQMQHLILEAVVAQQDHLDRLFCMERAAPASSS